MEIYTSLVLALGIWRMSTLLVYERGPFEVFERIRKSVGITHDDTHEPIGWDEDRYFAKMLSCVWCTSMSLALVAVVLYFVFGEIITHLLFPFFIGALAIGYERIINGTS